MRHFLKKLLLFRMGQKTSRGFARSIVGGLKYMRRHS
jgi:hypothetical protein